MSGDRDPDRRLYAHRRGTHISLTPLIDVVFILLVFFMLATSLLDWRVVEMDVSAGSGAPASMEGALVVEIRPDGIRLAGERISSDTLLGRVREYLSRRPRGRILVKPAPGVALQEAVRVLDTLAAAGARDVSLTR